MTPRIRLRCLWAFLAGGVVLLGAAWFGGELDSASALGQVRRLRQKMADQCPPTVAVEHESNVGGTWYWLRSPEQEHRVVAERYDRYCVRCHGIDGRGVWDIPDVPDLTNERWQNTRREGQLARAILEGRGAVMPAFRGTLTLEEAFAMERYLRRFPEKSRPATELHAPKKVQPEPAPLPPEVSIPRTVLRLKSEN